MAGGEGAGGSDNTGSSVSVGVIVVKIQGWRGAGDIRGIGLSVIRVEGVHWTLKIRGEWHCISVSGICVRNGMVVG